MHKFKKEIKVLGCKKGLIKEGKNEYMKAIAKRAKEEPMMRAQKKKKN